MVNPLFPPPRLQGAGAGAASLSPRQIVIGLQPFSRILPAHRYKAAKCCGQQEGARRQWNGAWLKVGIEGWVGNVGCKADVLEINLPIVTR